MPFGDVDDTAPGTPGDLGNDPEHAGVTDSALEAAARAQFATAPAATEEDSGAGEVDEAPLVTEPAPDATADTFDLGDGVSISREQARALAQFDEFLQADPALAELISGTIIGTHRVVPVDGSEQAPAAPAPAANQPPDDLDLDDPAIKTLWDALQGERSAREQQSQLIAQHEAMLQNTTAATVQSAITRSKASYQQQHNLSDKDMTEIEEVAGRLNIVTGLMSPVDPVSGLPRKVDPLRALESAYEVAHWQIPRLRDAQIAEFQKETKADTTRKKKLSSLGGTSGNTTTRTQDTVPTNPAERRAAMIREVAQAMNGSWVNPDEA